MTPFDWMKQKGLNAHSAGKYLKIPGGATFWRVLHKKIRPSYTFLRHVYVESLGELTPNDLLIDDEWRSALAERLNKLAQDQRQ